ncbi:hypothetical protein [Hydrogenivirga sp.]
MGQELSLLEGMLFNTMFSEIEDRYNDVVDIYRNDYEILSLAQHLKGISDMVGEVYREIPNPHKKLGEDLYTTLYQVLKDVSSILYDLSIAEGDQLSYVVVQAYRKLDSINSLFEKLV